MLRGRDGKIVSLFVEDLPDTMDYVAMRKFFANFGMVKDVFIPKKKSKEEVPMIKVHIIGNGWLYRSAVATFGEHPIPDSLFESFMKEVKGNPTVRRMGYNKVLLTFMLVEEMQSFVEEHTKQSSIWFNSVVPWSVKTECSYDREVWLTCYGVPVHAWNVSTFCSIGQFWGEVTQIDEDTAKCVRCDIGNVKVFTNNMSVIN
ncbi:hypothetical protein Dimus_015362 [Dionaea muscipula]